MFAGGAVVAEQRTAVSYPYQDRVVWIHADPMTSSRQEVDKSGTAASLPPSAREEYEALGQKVNPQSPQSQVPPSQYADYIGTASEPEWQCLNGSERSFWELPAQCKVAAAQKFSTAEFLAALNPEKERGNANKISEYADSPLPDYSGGDEMLSYALTSSTKKDKKDKKKKRGGGGGGENPKNVVAEVNVPISFDNDALIDFSDTGLPDASVSGEQTQQQQTQQPQTKNLPTNGEIQSAIQSCIDSMFGGNGILVSSFTPSEKGIFGSIDISYIEGEATPKSVTITNDTMRYSRSDLNKINPYSKSPGGETLGITFGTRTTNYTARDRDSSNAFGLMVLSSSKAKFLETQIHEFGHFLGNLFNKQHNVTDIVTGKEKTETGEAFEGCVSGVLLTNKSKK